MHKGTLSITYNTSCHPRGSLEQQSVGLVLGEKANSDIGWDTDYPVDFRGYLQFVHQNS